MMKADVLKALQAAQTAINSAINEATAAQEANIPNGDVVSKSDKADVTVTNDGKVTVVPKKLNEMTDNTKSASRPYWASAAGIPCSRCGGTGRA